MHAAGDHGRLPLRRNGTTNRRPGASPWACSQKLGEGPGCAGGYSARPIWAPTRHPSRHAACPTPARAAAAPLRPVPRATADPVARLLLTGSAGLIGRAIRRTITARGHEVIGLDCALPPGHPDHGDVCQPGLVAARAKDCAGILHLAAIARVGDSNRDPRRCRAITSAASATPSPPPARCRSSRGCCSPAAARSTARPPSCR
jgi:hypothetical protein